MMSSISTIVESGFSSLSRKGNAFNPFDLEREEDFERWRDYKRASFPRQTSDLVVEITDPNQPSDKEVAALMDRLKRANMAVYVCANPLDEEEGSKKFVRALGRRFGLQRLDANLCADTDAITPLHDVHNGEGARARYIPYTNRPISWHVDGYYNTPDRQIRGMVLHCVRPSQSGGESALYDPEMAYLLMREANPDYIRALAHPEAMHIPPNQDERNGQEIRAISTGPVFSLDAKTATLHMRFSARQRNIIWRDDAVTREAVAFLNALLEDGKPYIFQHRMAAGQGLVCNNVLHNRTGFQDPEDGAPGRLYLRARYFDRISGTGVKEVYAELAS
ncbi:TauD/TfdA family dioxygenase [Varunaivibrio sulfuroxidans]|uniref:Alpha-ketoglutarate-dependent taurine dioxygenase n=1 Tax=Varunaivibrio sulfuroxidans TaxID=1773489 RepID=A0A4R3J657_9PROT|nr:TauD/TfdA family dioxygenase [Varunaivibrio sulfuroxidans]TCS60316.1 alpha-ketoglutarate-dependent taurine dioxygenase [Varunaivibrio sulfuroxidans]WES30997.1 TauD/TfdA family dioxygenase [Varunaivibrio sulfuroxidans]